MDYVVFSAGFLALFFASVTDFRSREVPDLLSYGFLSFSIAYGLLKAWVLGSWQPVLAMLSGLVVLGGLGLLLLYGGQWGGADMKLLAALGALFGLWVGQYDALLFLVLLLFTGAAYGIVYTLALAAAHREAFVSALREQLVLPRVRWARRITLAACFLILLLVFIVRTTPLLLFAVLLYLFFWLWVTVRVVENELLTKEYAVAQLTEGDWVTHDVVVHGKTVYKKSELGVTKKDIAALRRAKVKRVMVKEGIPFVPSFLAAFILLWFVKPVLVSLLMRLATIVGG